MSFIEPSGENRVIGPDPVGPAPKPEAIDTAAVADTPVETTDPEVFDRDYVEKLRRENAKWRTQAQEYNAVFEGMDDEDKQAWFQIMNLAQSGDPDALAYLGEVLGFTQPAPEPEPDPSAQFDPDAFRAQILEEARNEWRQEQSQAEAARSQAEQIQTIQSRAKDEFGIEPGSDDYVLLLKYANEIDPDTLDGTDLLSAANDQLKAARQAQWDAYVASKAGDAANSPTTLTGSGQAPSTARTPQTWAEARQAAHERLSNLG